MVLKAISSLIDKMKPEAVDAEQSRQHELKLATALLLVEVSRADYEEDITEHRAMLDLLKQFFDLSDDEAELLVDRARAEADHAASLQRFTRHLHEELDPAEKCEIVEMLWRVAMADDRLDKHEDHLVRKVAGLLYVPHGDLIRIRNKVKEI